MPDFNSPLGRRQFAASNQRVLTVPDEEMGLNAKTLSAQAREIIQEEPQLATEKDIEVIQAARKARMLVNKKITPIAKERIEILTGLGRCIQKIEFEGITFSLRSLKDKEMREVVFMSNTCVNKVDAYFEARLQTLARSIYEIDSQPISLVLSSDKLEDVINWLEDMDEGLVEFIHTHYLDMIKKNKEKFAIKNEDDAKEVVEEIKKS